MSDNGNKSVTVAEQQVNPLYERITTHVDSAKNNIAHSINTEMVKAYWRIGAEIVLFEQGGQERAQYGKSVLKRLSEKLQARYKRGFSVDTLELARKFYLEYQVVESGGKSETASRKLHTYDPNLSWSHYVELMRISSYEARKFYQIEAGINKWSLRELKRQIGSLLFDRIAKSKDKAGLKKLAYEGHEISQPKDAIKDPVILEFLGIPETHKLVESKLEQALIDNLQDFLLELGKGFAFVGRQKRLSFDGDHFYADLVFYHTILKCYVIIDIKTNPLSHGDLGQMLLYVNYFDANIKNNDDNPTIGLVLCTKKSDMMVKYTLGEKAKQIFASKYQLHLPTEKELESELKRELDEIKQKLKEDK